MSKYAELHDALTQQIADLGLSPDHALLLINAADACSNEHERETKGAAGVLQEVKLELATAREHRDQARGELGQARNTLATAGGAIGQIFRHVDGQHLVELAFKQDPRRARICLIALGGSQIAGELRDRSDPRSQIQLFSESARPSLGQPASG